MDYYEGKVVLIRFSRDEPLMNPCPRDGLVLGIDHPTDSSAMLVIHAPRMVARSFVTPCSLITTLFATTSQTRPNAYGLGVGMDGFGRPVYARPHW